MGTALCVPGTVVSTRLRLAVTTKFIDEFRLANQLKQPSLRDSMKTTAVGHSGFAVRNNGEMCAFQTIIALLVRIAVCCSLAEVAGANVLKNTEQFFAAGPCGAGDAVRHGVIKSSLARSTTRCAAACLRVESCKNFCFSAKTGECELGDATVVSTSDAGAQREECRCFDRKGRENVFAKSA